MKRGVLLLSLALVWLSVLCPAKERNQGKAVRDLGRLEAEYELAKLPKTYFVLDVGAETLELRVRGTTLRRWSLEKIRFWGRPEFSKTVELTRKSALRPPQRNVITPGAAEVKPGEDAKFELEALELKDMPRKFRLDFDSGLRISVTTAESGVLGSGQTLGEALGWYVWLPVRNLLSSWRGRPLSELQITFPNDGDAQAVYWIFFEGIKGLVF